MREPGRGVAGENRGEGPANHTDPGTTTHPIPMLLTRECVRAMTAFQSCQSASSSRSDAVAGVSAACAAAGAWSTELSTPAPTSRAFWGGAWVLPGMLVRGNGSRCLPPLSGAAWHARTTRAWRQVRVRGGLAGGLPTVGFLSLTPGMADARGRSSPNSGWPLRRPNSRSCTGQGPGPGLPDDSSGRCYLGVVGQGEGLAGPDQGSRTLLTAHQATGTARMHRKRTE